MTTAEFESPLVELERLQRAVGRPPRSFDRRLQRLRTREVRALRRIATAETALAVAEHRASKIWRFWARAEDKAAVAEARARVAEEKAGLAAVKRAIEKAERKAEERRSWEQVHAPQLKRIRELDGHLTERRQHLGRTAAAAEERGGRSWSSVKERAGFEERVGKRLVEAEAKHHVDGMTDFERLYRTEQKAADPVQAQGDLRR